MKHCHAGPLAFTMNLDLIIGRQACYFLPSRFLRQLTVANQLYFQLQELENPVQTVLKSKGDLLAHITGKVRGGMSFWADLVQRFSNASRALCPSLSLICLLKLQVFPKVGFPHYAKMATEVPHFASIHHAISKRGPPSW